MNNERAEVVFGNIYFGKKVLVTGHTGFKGSWLTAWLRLLGANVAGYSVDVPTTPSLFVEAGLEKEVTHIQADVRDGSTLKRIIGEFKPDFVFHLAAQAIVSQSYADPVGTLSTNIMGTTNILEALRTNDLQSCIAIMITSDKCYDNREMNKGYSENDPMGGKDTYSCSKGAAELVIKSYHHSFFKNHQSISIASARAGNVIGGGDWAQDRIVPDCMKAWNEEKTVTIRNPLAIRPWQHVLEPLSGYLQLGHSLSLNAALSGESYNFGPINDEVHSVRSLLQDLARQWGFADVESAFSLATEKKFHEAGLLQLNCNKALQDLQWRPALSHQDLISFTGNWYRKFYQPEFDAGSYTRKQIANYERIAAGEGISWAVS